VSVRAALLALLVLLLPTGCQAAQMAYGDVNGDGSLDIKDVGWALRAALKLVDLSPEAYHAADVAPLRSPYSFGDGTVDVSDVMRILRRMLGLEPDPWPARLTYFPLDPGNMWIYTDTQGNSVLATVEGLADVDGQPAYEVRLSTGESYYLRQDEQPQDPETPLVLRLLRRVDSNGVASTYIPPIDLLRYPATPGRTWEGQVTIPAGVFTMSGTYTTTIVGEETVTTPAGQFDAIKVHTSLSATAFGISIHLVLEYHYAPWFGWADLNATDLANGPLISTSANVHQVAYP